MNTLFNKDTRDRRLLTLKLVKRPEVLEIVFSLDRQNLESLHEEDFRTNDSNRLNIEAIRVSLLANEETFIEFVVPEALSAHGTLPFIFDLNFFLGIELEDVHGAHLDQLGGLLLVQGLVYLNQGLQLVVGG